MEEQRDRNEKGQFVKGNKAGVNSPLSNGLATEMQKRSVKKRKENKTIAETLRAYLNEEGGGGYTKGELLVMQAVKNHKEGKLTFGDLKDLTAVLGETTLNINASGELDLHFKFGDEK